MNPGDNSKRICLMLLGLFGLITFFFKLIPSDIKYIIPIDKLANELTILAIPDI